MTSVTIEREFREKVSDQIRLLSEGRERYRVLTPFFLDDGDNLAIVLKRDNGHWVLTDEGHTYMHLTYDLEERSLHQGTRQVIIGNALTAFEVEDRQGELRLTIKDKQYGDALYDFVQALLRISDVTYLSRERARSTFMDDFRNFMEEQIPPNRRTFDWHDRRNDPEGAYRVDCRVNGMAQPLLVFALPGDTKTRDATISLHQFEKWGLTFQSISIFENQEEINRKVLARFSNVSGKQYSSLSGNRERISRELQRVLAVG